MHIVSVDMHIPAPYRLMICSPLRGEGTSTCGPTPPMTDCAVHLMIPMDDVPLRVDIRSPVDGCAVVRAALSDDARAGGAVLDAMHHTPMGGPRASAAPATGPHAAPRRCLLPALHHLHLCSPLYRSLVHISFFHITCSCTCTPHEPHHCASDLLYTSQPSVSLPHPTSLPRCARCINTSKISFRRSRTAMSRSLRCSSHCLPSATTS